MASRECVGCGIPLTNDVITREHILPRWLAEELHSPGASYKRYRHDEDTAQDELVRSHDLGSLAIKNVCASCNNGWMASLEGHARPTLLGLLNMKTPLLQMTPEDRTTVAAWAIKTAFMIASAQPSISNLPWDLFRGLAKTPEQIPNECPVLAGQLDFLDGFMHSSRTDLSSSNGEVIQLRWLLDSKTPFRCYYSFQCRRANGEDFRSTFADLAVGKRNTCSLCLLSNL